jgi:hypothetical protein
MTGNCSLVTGVVGSLIASVVFSATAVLLSAVRRRAKGKDFVGTYEMFDASGGKSRGGTVTISRGGWWESILSPRTLLNVYAEHGTGRNPGTEDWRADLEVLDPPQLASGMYRFPDRQAGLLHLLLKFPQEEITEYATPYDGEPLIRVLKRLR